MKGCNEIRRLIDEADQPDVFPFEAHTHLSACGDCNKFADERIALRRIIASGVRVSTPPNFDAVLHGRIAEAKARKAFSWFSPAGMMRLGAATAGVVIALLAIQFSGIISRPGPESSSNTFASAPKSEPGDVSATIPPAADRQNYNTPPVAEPQPDQVSHPARVRQGASIRAAVVAARSRAPQNYPDIEDGGVVLVREQNGDREVALPAVSVGAQPLLYVSATRSAPRSSAGTSF